MIYLHVAIVNKIYVTVTLGWHDSNYMYLPASDIHPSANVTGLGILYLRNRSALAVNCCVIIHCLEVSCKEDQITSAQRE